MTQEEFQKLLKRYRAGNCSEDEIQMIEAWFKKIEHDVELSDIEKSDIRSRMRGKLKHAIAKPNHARRNVLGSPFFRIAASVSLLIIAGYFFYQLKSSHSHPTSGGVGESDMVVHANTGVTTLKVILPDSSTVDLQPQATISYVARWTAPLREVHLVGDAFFDVVRDPQRPFYVYSGRVVTRVLGTSFRVSASPGARSVEVAVTTGKVSVYEDSRQKSSALGKAGEATGVVLTPNEKVQYFADGKHWVTSLVEAPKPRPESNKAVEFLFSNAPLGDIVKAIERNYLIDVIFEAELSGGCTFTGDVSAMELYDMLNVVCKSTGTNYEVKGTKILITGKGCE